MSLTKANASYVFARAGEPLRSLLLLLALTHCVHQLFGSVPVWVWQRFDLSSEIFPHTLRVMASRATSRLLDSPWNRPSAYQSCACYLFHWWLPSAVKARYLMRFSFLGDHFFGAYGRFGLSASFLSVSLSAHLAISVVSLCHTS